jgi:hypothetical protein
VIERGIRPEDLLARGLITEPPTTGAELVAYWEREGVIGTRPAITDSQAHARNLRRAAESAWDEELARREQEIRSGAILGEPSDAVFARIRDRLG